MTIKPPEHGIVARIEASFAAETPTGKRIAGWLLANLAQIPFETADSIARSAAASGITVGRYLRRLGYRNLDDVKRGLRQEGGGLYQPWGVTDRLDAYRQFSAQPQREKLRLSLARELAAIEHAYLLAQSESFANITRHLVEADAVFVVGIQSTRGIANAFFSHLEYLRPRVWFADGLSGTYVESLNSEFANPYLVVTDTRAYSVIARQYCEVASRRGLKLALLTDVYCPWARDYPMDLLQLKTDTGNFWDSLAPFSCLFNLLLSAVVERLGGDIEQRLAANRLLQHELGQFQS
ncbi:MurR/RpiR family transcriptional regulator [Acerihabitans arboris]|uniref:MurR/RpiR family transcriptional regulator n=1 Tax=Acerihabitans arboris TaxID=2691583 RepID=A0A845SGV9_9GAMM|nr:MurR/RpiR family transcriptional regulator [Acerihabitans arboris]NDL62276.1 MurR/RpiR family transcriptional regulator [Acerihabitans arboris]